MTTFVQLGVRPELAAALTSQGITEAFPIQEATIRDALAGRDVCGKADTGSGKTLAFGLPMLQGTKPAQPRRPRALVIVPTRELAQQVFEVLQPLGKPIGLNAATFYGGTSMERQIRTLRRRIDVVVATPGRLIDLVKRGSLSLGDVEMVALDEADRMADMGFLAPVEWILGQLKPQRQTFLFSATLDRDVDVLVKRYLRNPARHDVASKDIRMEDMNHHFLAVHKLDRVKVAAACARGVTRTIMFVRTKRGADRLVEQLNREGIRAGTMHGDLRQSARDRALRNFANGSSNVLVATDVASRGIHVDDIELVLHFDPPADHKTYLHRSGRTARAGSKGTVATFVLFDQMREVEGLQKRLRLRQPIVEVFSNDPRLARLEKAMTSTRPPRAAAS